MFWIAVTYSRCQKVLSNDAPENLTQSFKDDYQELLRTLGIATWAQLQLRCREIERALPYYAAWRKTLWKQTTKSKLIDPCFILATRANERRIDTRAIGED